MIWMVFSVVNDCDGDDLVGWGDVNGVSGGDG